ncbi:MAG TPA: transcription antitermination factor NusB [Thermoanaerobaculia bacterium]|jgi:16S rRNA (cytosine967-C5)-methyltransferase
MNERQRAAQLLDRIERESLYASLVLLEESGFVRTLVLGVLRWRSQLDWTIATLAKRSVLKLDRSVLTILRLGLCQIQHMNVPPHAAVSETVDLAPQRARGFVNAILRAALRGAPRPEDLATRTAHPKWLIDRWSARYGAERAAKIAGANQELSYPDVLALTEEAPPEAEKSQLVDSLWKLHGSSAELDRARFHPMDEGSAVIAAIARACGEEVLDLAAAPGGKSLYMQHQGARVISNDVSIGRLRQLQGRTRVVVSDGRFGAFRRPVEVVLLDAPCSATGTIRKNPEIKWRLREADLAAFAKLQRELLASAMQLAAKYVVYSTCSLEGEENDAIVAGCDDASVAGYERADAADFVPEGAKQWVEDGVLRLTPESGADGFTAFVLKKLR